MTFTALHIVRYTVKESKSELKKLETLWQMSQSNFRRCVASRCEITPYVTLKSHWATLCRIARAWVSAADIPGQIDKIAFLTEQEEDNPENITIYDLQDIHSEILSVLHILQY